MSSKSLQELVREVVPFGVEARRWLHQHPELSFQEKETSAYVAAKLREMGYEPQVGIGGGYGIKAVLKGARPGRTIALRADMDALPIAEETGLPFASTIPGVMHACGHDMHTATLLATAKALKSLEGELAGNVVFIFQPAEETLPGGAISMIRDGVLENPHVDAVFGMHVDPFLPAGQLAFGAGPRYAAADMFDVTIYGRGGHGAAPHQTVDAVLVGAQVVSALQHIHSRQMDPMDQLVVTVGHFQAGSKHNIIADTALLQGTVRNMSPALRERIAAMMEQVIAGVCATYGAGFKFDYHRGYPVLVNDPAMTEVARAAGAKTVGADSVKESPSAMYGEDFSYFLQERPGSFGSLGAREPDATECYPCHHPKLMVADEQAMPVGVAYYLNLVTTYLAG
ncbi:MAG: M20 metallopeptidase family protein [Bacillota bacterium]